MKSYSFRQARQLLKNTYKWFKRRSDSLDPALRSSVETDLLLLDEAIVKRDRAETDRIAHQVEGFSELHCKKSLFDYIKEFVVAIALALVIAVVVRQMWFEPYEIPSGSMRPTFKELDHVGVTKTQFGLNVPLETEHLYFDPSLVQRTSIVIFSGANIPSLDQTITQFLIFPYTKRYVKRMIGLPGDSIYFYGGKLYGVDKDGNALNELQTASWMEPLEYVPMLDFGDLRLSQTPTQIEYKKMDQLIGRILRNTRTSFVGQVYNGKKWITDNPSAQLKPHNTIETFSDFYGMRNYAMARLLTPQELKAQTGMDAKDIGEGVLYLELRHDPSLNYPTPLVLNSNLVLNPYISVIPLQQEHLDAIMDNMYTARFIVKNGHAYRYSPDGQVGDDLENAPAIPGMPDGTYEFYHGKPSKVAWGGILRDIPDACSLCSNSPENVKRLYNLGIEVHNFFAPAAHNTFAFPHRYVYFREGDLYIMGAPVLRKEDPTLVAFNKREEQRLKEATNDKPYVPFRDYGAPVKADGSYDVEFIRTFGITVPEGNYFVLGDNHAMSSDSREFGFVPQNNLQGRPSMILWPPGERWGFPSQKPYPILTLPRLIVWGIAGLILLLWYLYHRYTMSRLYIPRK